MFNYTLALINFYHEDNIFSTCNRLKLKDKEEKHLKICKSNTSNKTQPYHYLIYHTSCALQKCKCIHKKKKEKEKSDCVLKNTTPTPYKVVHEHKENPKHVQKEI